MAIKRELAKVHGFVQGVFFRQTVLEIAGRHDVAGTVRNMADGTLEIDVEGEALAVDAFLDDVAAHPPPSARVLRTTREPRTPSGMAGFKPLHSERKPP
jgi:acylphosphatase